MEVVQFFIELGYRVKIDSLLSIVFRRPIIDIFDFDYQVHKKFDPENNYSLEYLLNKYYDPEIIEKIKYFSGAKEQGVKMKKQYYSLKKILSENADYNIIIGERSNGKTYATLEYILTDYVNNNNSGAYIRRWKDDI